jgi:orotate phosphoribosyltransferase
MKWDELKKDFIEFIIKSNVIGFFKDPIRLKSGRESNWYVNWRSVAEDVYLMDLLTDYLLAFIEFLRLKPNCFFGVPEGATKLAILTQFKWAKTQKDYKPGNYILTMGRGQPKTHGDIKDRYFLGFPRGDVIILEDTTTTGDSLIEIIKKLNNLDVNVIAAITLTDRNEMRDDGVAIGDLIKKYGVDYHAMSEAAEILPRMELNGDIKKKLSEYFEKYGSKSVFI